MTCPLSCPSTAQKVAVCPLICLPSGKHGDMPFKVPRLDKSLCALVPYSKWPLPLFFFFFYNFHPCPSNIPSPSDSLNFLLYLPYLGGVVLFLVFYFKFLSLSPLCGFVLRCCVVPATGLVGLHCPDYSQPRQLPVHPPLLSGAWLVRHALRPETLAWSLIGVAACAPVNNRSNQGQGTAKARHHTLQRGFVWLHVSAAMVLFWLSNYSPVGAGGEALFSFFFCF